MSTLEERKKSIEAQITELYHKRQELANEIQKQAKVKEASNLSELIANALEDTPKQFPEHAFVACQGIEGSNSQAAFSRD